MIRGENTMSRDPNLCASCSSMADGLDDGKRPKLRRVAVSTQPLPKANESTPYVDPFAIPDAEPAISNQRPYRYLINLPGVGSGRTVVEGTRLGVHDVVGLLANGATVDDVVRNFPILSKSQVYECLAYYEDNRPEIDALIVNHAK